jgi:hypothetical protein
MTGRACLAAMCFAALLVARGVAAADDTVEAKAAANTEAKKAFSIGSRPVWFVLAGVTTGGTIALSERGAFVGGELSVARLRDGRYVGLYGDAYYDWGADGTYVTTGLELGRKVFGIDAGAAFRFVDGERDAGVAARVNVSVGVFGLYARYMYLDAMSDEHVLQIGAVLKLPLATIGDGR